MSGGLCVRFKVVETSPSLGGFVNVLRNGKSLMGERRRDQARRNLLLLPATAQAGPSTNITLSEGFSPPYFFFQLMDRS